MLHGVPPPTQHCKLDPDGNAPLFEVISSRYLKSSVALTSHVGIASWSERLGDPTPMMAAAMLDRLLHRGLVVCAIEGPSYRMRSHQAAPSTCAEGWHREPWCPECSRPCRPQLRTAQGHREVRWRSSAAARSSFPTSRLASRRLGTSTAPACGTPRCAYPGRVGLGGLCPHCEEPVAVPDLLHLDDTPTLPAPEVITMPPH